MDDEEIEAYLRKHTFNGAMRELRDTWSALWRAIAQEAKRLFLNIVDRLER